MTIGEYSGLYCTFEAVKEGRILHFVPGDRRFVVTEYLQVQTGSEEFDHR
jgi:hypothetical protein